jgi:S-adenosylmethionine-diacylglycerol 3-amino-3-carboxypropyl transferase
MDMEDKSNYFSKLNYTLANEDTAFELGICEELKPHNILSVCGSGGRFLPLLKSSPGKIVALDLAQEQLWLASLREASIRQFSHRDFLVFWGFPPYGVQGLRDERKQLFHRLEISQDARRFFLFTFEQNNFEGLLYLGKWEKTITSIPKIVRRFVGKYYDNIFDFTSMSEQNKFFDERLQSFFWKIVPRLVLLVTGNSAFFNSVLYSGSFVKKNIPEGYYDFYRLAYRRLFYNGLARENFFLQLCFLGEIKYSEGVTIEAVESVFTACKYSLMRGSRVELVQRDVLQFVEETKEKFDFVSLSDVPSYFRGATEREYMQALKKCLNPGAVVVTRCYLRIPEGTDLAGYKDITERYQTGIEKEKVQMYKIFCYEFIG